MREARGGAWVVIMNPGSAWSGTRTLSSKVSLP